MAGGDKAALPPLTEPAADADVERQRARVAAVQHEHKAPAGLKLAIIVAMSVFWTSYALLLYNTRQSKTSSKSQLYYFTTVVFLNEVIKCSLSLLAVWREHGYSVSATRRLLAAELWAKPWELARMSVPSLVYALQNNLDFVALEHLDASVYQVTIQLKVVTTAVFMVLMLGRRYSLQRWLSILALGAGVALVQLDAANQSTVVASGGGNGSSSDSLAGASVPQRNYALGLTAVLCTCVTAGFAGVYFEKVLKEKNSTTPFWVRNIQMYLCGMCSAAISCVLKDASNIARDGFFHGYNEKVVLIVALLACGGVSISLVMLYLDNMHKSFVAACNIVFVALGSYALFGAPLGPYFLLGAAVVCTATVMYNSVKT